MNLFRDRADAGRRLARKLRSLAAEDPVVVALPRGGVPIGYQIAQALRAPLDVCVVRKVGAPWHPELGLGAVAEGGHWYINQDIVEHVGVSRSELARLIHAKQGEVQERVQLFRGHRARTVLLDRSVILADDGIATGGTVRAALRSLRAQQPKSIVLAVPVAAQDTLSSLAAEVDHLVCLETPADLQAVGLWYLDFEQVTDQQVVRLLQSARNQEGIEHRVAGY